MLTGLRIISFCHWLQGPAASQYLADMGADVIKVEPPGGGLERRWAVGGRTVEGVGTLYLAANRNIRTVQLDLKQPQAKQIALRLIENADVVMENYRPGVMDRLGLGYCAVSELKQEIIYASATGYGANGPLSDRPGQDLLVQARAGLIAATGEAGVRPTPIGASAVDQHGGTLLALGILGAYVQRLRTGRGCRVEGSLYNAAIDLMMESLTHYFSGGHDQKVLTRDHRLSSWYMDAPYGVYPLEDCFVAISMNDPRKLAKALESDTLTALADCDRFVERNRYAEALGKALQGKSFADIEPGFLREEIWYERVRNFDELADDPQAEYAQIFCKTVVGRSEATLINHPIRYDGGVPPLKRLALNPGEDSREIMAGLGYSETEIEELVLRGVLGVPEVARPNSE